MSVLPPGTPPDLVLVFTPLLKTQVVNKSAPPALLQQRAAEYDALVAALKSAGFHVASRAAGPSRPAAILLFLKAESSAISAVAAADRINDYLHGAQSNSDNAAEQLHAANPFAIPPVYTPADALRYAYLLATTPPSADPAEPGKISGAGVRTDGTGPFPHVTDLTALHDRAFDSAWVHRWTHIGALRTLGVQDLDAVRNHYGEEVALYFGFLVFYFKSLAPIALLGFSYWLMGGAYSHLYSLALVIWSCVTVELWAYKEKKFAVRWGCQGVTRVDPPWSGFKPRATVRDEVTGQEVQIYEWWRREIRSLFSLVVMVAFALVLAAILTGNFVLEIFVTKLYTGSGAALLAQAPTVVFSTLVPVVMAIWQAAATYLSKNENPQTEQVYHSSLTIKVFALQSLVAYGALFLSAYVYIPFGQTLLNGLISRGFFASHIDSAVAENKLHYDAFGRVAFQIDPGRMHTQLFAASVTSQVVNAFTELVLPIVLRAVTKRAEKSTAVDEKEAQASEKTRMVSYALDQLNLPEYDIFGDYAEMASQFGFITLWSTIWTLTPVMGFVNNFFEIRSDAAKISINARRPIPKRVETIGPWLGVFRFLSYLAAVSNVALVWLFQAAPGTKGGANATVLRSHAAWGGTHQSVPLSQQTEKVMGVSHVAVDIDHGLDGQAIVLTFLAALAGGQALILLRALVDRVLRLAVWQGSAPQLRLARRAHRARTSLLELFSLTASPATVASRNVAPPPKEQPARLSARPLSGGNLAADYATALKEYEEKTASFWAEPDVPASAILDYAKTE